MFKKLLVFVCVLALAVGVFSMTAAAQTSQDENAFKAGYAKVDINPWWSIWENEGKKFPPVTAPIRSCPCLWMATVM